MRVPTGACVLAVGLVLAGCSEEPPPATLPPLPSVGSATPMPTIVAVPAPGQQKTSQGASAFATHFVESIGRAYNEADPSVITALTTDGCGGCEVLSQGVRELREADRRREGGAYTVTSAVTPALAGGDAVVDIVYVRAAGRVITASGEVVATAGPVPATTAQVRVLWREGSWVVQGYRTFAS